jgi:hypothetical protein
MVDWIFAQEKFSAPLTPLRLSKMPLAAALASPPSEAAA